MSCLGELWGADIVVAPVPYSMTLNHYGGSRFIICCELEAGEDMTRDGDADKGQGAGNAAVFFYVACGIKDCMPNA